MNTPILILLFNRPKETEILIDRLKVIKPRKIYLNQDGPRENFPRDKELCQKVRVLIEKLNWECEIKTKINEINLGCKKSVSSALNWFFDNEEHGIILEDDCIPSVSFFMFCEKMLVKYKSSFEVFTISGSNFQKNKLIGNGDYYFSKYAHCWGWATWKRAWVNYDNEMVFWEKFKLTDKWKKIHNSLIEKKYWENVFDKVRSNKIDSWAYIWLACVWYNQGKNIIPNKNLILNIGFNKDATNTIISHEMNTLKLKFSELSDKIKDPSEIEINKNADKYVFNNHFNGIYNFWPWRLLYILKILIKDPETFWLRIKKYLR